MGTHSSAVRAGEIMYLLFGRRDLLLQSLLLTGMTCAVKPTITKCYGFMLGTCGKLKTTPHRPPLTFYDALQLGVPLPQRGCNILELLVHRRKSALDPLHLFGMP